MKLNENQGGKIIKKHSVYEKETYNLTKLQRRFYFLCKINMRNVQVYALSVKNIFFFLFCKLEIAALF